MFGCSLFLTFVLYLFVPSFTVSHKKTVKKYIQWKSEKQVYPQANATFYKQQPFHVFLSRGHPLVLRCPEKRGQSIEVTSVLVECSKQLMMAMYRACTDPFYAIALLCPSMPVAWHQSTQGVSEPEAAHRGEKSSDRVLSMVALRCLSCPYLGAAGPGRGNGRPSQAGQRSLFCWWVTQVVAQSSGLRSFVNHSGCVSCTP